jgi:hypothetical protein
MKRTCISQSPVDLLPLPSPKLSVSTKENTNRHRRFRQPYQVSVIAAIPVLLLLYILLVDSVTRICVDALLLLDPVVARSRRTIPNTKAFIPPQISSFASISNRGLHASSRTKTVLRASNDNKSGQKKKKAQGVYVRPSGAIEKGSGFFVPGLEGPKVRLLIGLILLGATAVNHFVVGDVGSFGSKPKLSGGDEFLSFSETTAVFYSVLLLFQSAIEYAKEALPEEAASPRSRRSGGGSAKKKSSLADNTEVLEQKWSTPSGDDVNESSYRSEVQWAAASYLSMTPTTQIMLLTSDGNNEGGVQYRLRSGDKNDSGASSDTTSSGVSAALDELSKSKGGRIALPLTHPAVKALLGAHRNDTSASTSGESSSKLRTVILQRITDDSCWMVASDQLLAGYTAGDLKWLGKLAGYVAALE